MYSNKSSDFGASFLVQYSLRNTTWLGQLLHFMYPTIELLANKTSQGKQTVLPFIDPAARIYRTKSTIKHMSLWTLQ